MSRNRTLARLPRLLAGVLLAGGLVVGMLAGCTAPPPANTAQGRCEQQADRDPAVKAVLLQEPARSGDPSWQEQLAQARRKAVNDCLVAAGLAPRGGVQPVSHARYGLGWY